MFQFLHTSHRPLPLPNKFSEKSISPVFLQNIPFVCVWFTWLISLKNTPQMTPKGGWHQSKFGQNLPIVLPSPPSFSVLLPILPYILPPPPVPLPPPPPFSSMLFRSLVKKSSWTKVWLFKGQFKLAGDRPQGGWGGGQRMSAAKTIFPSGKWRGAGASNCRPILRRGRRRFRLRNLFFAHFSRRATKFGQFPAANLTFHHPRLSSLFIRFPPIIFACPSLALANSWQSAIIFPFIFFFHCPIRCPPPLILLPSNALLLLPLTCR